ncbi:ABC transporter permease [Mucilaginibacter mali]|uniref:ABC transporter permease n=1 Tax=Mucilaginibacter mali TaxID=2740462 RepID=A0A7D4UCY5_9SPHI|nr:ABC transporter permease [Mucilaginibacter mali]QKJ29939.1 ABC transporter permease [Mucilaginibacter mali]
MLKNYFTIAWRNVQRNKGYTLMNIAGLAFGLAAFIAALVYVNYETGFDKWDKQLSRTYRVDMKETWGEETTNSAWTPFPLAAQLVANCPEVRAATRISDKGQQLVTVGDKALYIERVMAADSSFLTVMPYKLKYGSMVSALKQPGDAIITGTTSMRLFGTENSVGKTMVLNNGKTYTVAGVCEGKAQSHLDFDICVSFSSLTGTNWSANVYFTYALLRPGTSVDALSKKTKSLIVNSLATYSYGMMSAGNPKVTEPGKQPEQWIKANLGHSVDQVTFEPVADVHLFSKAKIYRDAAGNHPLFNTKAGNSTPVIFFGIAAVLVLVLACINYINLSIARAGKRAKESGIRKVMGAGRRQLIGQFLAEAFVQSFMAMLIGILLAKWIIAILNSAFGMHLSFFDNGSAMANWMFAGQLLLLVLAVTLLSGAYPAFILSSFQAARVLKGEITKSVKGKLLRNGLVILQFSISACFIIGMAVVYLQLHYINSTDPGFTTEQVMVLKPYSGRLIDPGMPDNRIDLLKTQMMQIPGVKSVAMTDFYPGTPSNVTGADASFNNRKGQVTFDFVHFDYFKTLNIKFVSGRDFSPVYASDTVNSAIINQTTARYMGYRDPIGQQVELIGVKYNIIGVVKDNHVAGYNSLIVPEVYGIAVQKHMFGGYKSILVKVNGREASATTRAVEKYWKSIEPGYPLRYTWLDQDFAKLLDKYERFGKITILLSAVSIVIALMGIFALSAFAAAQRTKEIGIRKVFGASAAGITAMLSMDFLKLIILALVVAFPVSYLASRKWLQEFAYQVQLSWLVFAAAGVVILVIALITVSIQAIKAAVVNPVKSLRTE